MTFRVTVKQDPIAIEFEAGSLAEAHAILTDQSTALGQIMEAFAREPADTSSEATPQPARRRGRRTNAEIEAAQAAAQAAAPAAPAVEAPPPPQPVVATAPDPLPVPGQNAPAAPPPPAPAAPAAVAPPPPPPPPPATPPVSVLAQKIVDNLKTRTNGSPDLEKQMADWLASSGLCTGGATFAEACDVILFTGDAQLQPIAAALAVS